MIDKGVVIKLADGSARVITCLVSMINQGYSIQKLIDYNIIGEQIYVLFNDVCNRDYKLMSCVLNNCPMEVIHDVIVHPEQYLRLVKELVEFD